MKYARRFIGLFLCFSLWGFGQNPADSLLSFFPLQPGNRWQYKVFIELDPFNRDTTYETFEVAGDTLMPNGRRYTILENHWDRYFRIDSSSLQVRAYLPWNLSCKDSERTMFDLTVQDTGRFIDCQGGEVLFETGIKPIGLLPDSAESLQFMWFDGHTHIYVLSQGIGISFWEQSELSYARAYLIAAIVDGVQYGQFIVGVEPAPGTARGFELLQNYPNPFNPATHLQFRLAEFGKTKLTIHNTLGEVVRTLVSEELSPGLHTLRWDGNDDKGVPAASGVYYYRLQTAKHVAVRKMVLLR